ncbi:hypothetical protein GCK32_016208 [Trichostrongylus colubriformis]|uniref:Biopterin-dependent aromatic amino acid hydroxylase family profile domain-containing protein n=1 Tax=Trichostrongylus colubriformis TaxID=6319 RepID=A0AAN8G542_TRICO
MASAMKFCYYTKNQVRRTLSTSTSVPDTRLEEFKRKFRRSGSLGIPFVPEENIKELFGKKGEVVIVEDEEGLPILTVIIKCQRGADGVSQMIANLPSNTRIKHMETRDSQDGSAGWMDILVELELELGRTTAEALEAMKDKGIQFYEVSQTMKPPVVERYMEPGSNDAITGSQWFPKTIYDLDICAKRVIMYGAGGLDADHPVISSSFSSRND